jgi:hypothetical protein
MNMNFFTKLIRCFSGKAKHTSKRLESDIKFSALIQKIQTDIIQANQSLDCVGLEYIEQFFYKKPKADLLEKVNYKFNAIEEALKAEDLRAADSLLLSLKVDVNELNDPSTGLSNEYCPKKASFEIPVFKNNIWDVEYIKVPLLALSPITIPKIKELTFTSNIQSIQQDGEDLYVSIAQENNETQKGKENHLDDSITELKISISPEQSNDELTNVITQYEQILRSNHTHKTK